MISSLCWRKKVPQEGRVGWRWSAICALLAIVHFATTAVAGIESHPEKKAHFMFEFVPRFKHGALWQDCEAREILVIKNIIAKVIVEDTGFSRKLPHHETYLPGHFNGGRHPGFDMTYDCPITCEGFPNEDWCEMLCEDEHTHLGHPPLDAVANDLKDRIHHSAMGHERIAEVECLGQVELVDVHLVVATSPFIQKPGGYLDKTDRMEL